MEKNKIAYLIRGEKWSNIRKVKDFRGEVKEVEWIDSQPAIVADIKAYEEFMEKMKAKGYEDLGDLEAYEQTIAEEAEQGAANEAQDPVNLDSKTKDELKAMLDAAEIVYDAAATKADLIALLEA